MEVQINQRYEIVFGLSKPRPGVYLGYVPTARQHRVLVRTTDKDPRDNKGHPRIYGFNSFEVKDNIIVTNRNSLLGTLKGRELELAKKLLINVGI